jgi:ribose 5-phosphate isomerase A
LIQNISKENAAQEAIKFVKNGMIVGLGTGSTAKIAVGLLGKKLSKDFKIKGIPTSIATEEQANKLGIELVDLHEYENIDIAIDGADEVSPNKSMIKGLGGALLREKKVEIKAKELIIIVDETKMVDILGKGPLPVEVDITNYERTGTIIERLGCKIELRIEANNKPFITDNGNYIYHLIFAEGIKDPVNLNKNLLEIKGVKDTGLFLNMATKVIIGSKNGTRIIE